jgi:hypothetical protein
MRVQRFVESLRAFDSHERGLLLAWALGSPFALCEDVRRRIGEVVGRVPPHWAFVAMDYTLNWLYAATRWSLNPESRQSPQPWPGDGALAASQEDVDLVVAWADDKGPHLILIEAKGFTGWRNAPMAHKAERLSAIFDGQLADVFDVHFMLVGPAPSKGLSTQAWPEWMKQGRRAHFVEIPDPGQRFAVRRCNEWGKGMQEQPTHWMGKPRTWTT